LVDSRRRRQQPVHAKLSRGRWRGERPQPAFVAGRAVGTEVGWFVRGQFPSPGGNWSVGGGATECETARGPGRAHAPFPAVLAGWPTDSRGQLAV